MTVNKVGSLFSGIGGIDLGFTQAGFTVAWANEIDKDACKTYRHNFPNTMLIEDDIRRLNTLHLSDIDVLTAGFPCQPFSVCGYKKGFSDNRGTLFFEIMRITDMKKPKVIFLENVANLVYHDNGKTFNIIYNELANRGYRVRYIIADACDYGIPQHRTRIYIFAFNDSKMYKDFSFPQQIKRRRHIFDVINPAIQVDKKYYVDRASSKYKELFDAITDDQQIYRFSDYGIQASKGGISFTLKANMGTWYDRVPYIKDNYGIRTITPNECLTLQGFPQSFAFPDIPEKNAYKQCGNTVCVPIVRMLAMQLKLLESSK